MGLSGRSLIAFVVTLAIAACLAGCPPSIVITVTPDGGTIDVGDTLQLSASSTDSADTIGWSSNNNAVATVNATGLVTAVSEGVAMITATGSNSGAADSVTVTVTVPPATITVTPDEASIGVGATQQLTAQSTDAADTFTWSTDDDTIATVDANGLVTGVAPGTAEITATGTNSGATGTATIEVTETVVTVSPDPHFVSVGHSSQLTAMSTLPADAFMWTSEDPEIVAVHPTTGEIAGVGDGTTTVTATGTVSGAIGSAQVTSVPLVQLRVTDDISQLQLILENAPDIIDEADLETIKEGLDAANDAFLAGNHCDGAMEIGLLLPAIQKVREAAKQPDPEEEAVEFADMTYAYARRIQYNMVLSRRPDDMCPDFDRVGDGSSAEAMESDTEHVIARVKFGAPMLAPITLTEQNLLAPEDAGIYTQLSLPDFPIESGDPGTPCIPVHREIVAVPQGATAIARIAELGPSETFKVKLMPHVPQPIDQIPEDPDANPADDLPEPPFNDFADRPFALDRRVYGVDEPYPSSMCTVVPLGSFRGVEFVQVQTFMGQYNPASEELTLYEFVDCEIIFDGGEDGFMPAYLTSPFESAPEVYVGCAINGGQIPLGPLDIAQDPKLIGEELLILTHSSLRSAADALAAWKNEKGIMTNVFDVGSGVAARDTTDEIDKFIQDRFDFALVKPSYILLLGDSNLIPPFLINRINDDLGDTIGSDWFYAWKPVPGPAAAGLATPSFAVGRIPVTTLEDANLVVQKIINYEKHPPGTGAVDSFYNNVVLAAEFQCCRLSTAEGTSQRTFTEASEYVRAELVQEGYNVRRIYRRTVDNGCNTCDPPRAPYVGNTTPRYYYDGGNLPADIGPFSGFAWNGTTQDIADAINDGAFLVMHRDHGWPGGWATPGFNTNNIVNDLENAPFLPVVFSINCSSGLFDDEANPGAEGTSPAGVYFAERLLRDPNGAVGVIGDTRVSPSWPNSAFAKGLFDAIWPGTLPSFGGNTSIRRLGDIMNHAKLYLLTQAGGAGPDGLSYANLYDMMYLYHVIGDPTLEIWTRDPSVVVIPSDFDLTTVDDDHLEVFYNVQLENVKITSYQINPADGSVRPLGRATVVDETAKMDLVQPPLPGVPIQLVATAPGAQSQSSEVDAKVWEAKLRVAK